MELPDVLAQSARSVAAQTQRRIEDVLVEWLDRAATDIPVDALPDDQVLALVDLQLSAPQQTELSDPALFSRVEERCQQAGLGIDGTQIRAF